MALTESTLGYSLDGGVGALGEFGEWDGELEMWSRTFTVNTLGGSSPTEEI